MFTVIPMDSAGLAAFAGLDDCIDSLFFAYGVDRIFGCRCFNPRHHSPVRASIERGIEDTAGDCSLAETPR